MSRNRQRMTAHPPSDVLAPATVHGPEESLQTHFWLTPDDLQLLDDWMFQMRRNGWRRVTRSACIRGLVSVFREHPPDLRHVTNEHEFLAAIHAALLQDSHQDSS